MASGAMHLNHRTDTSAQEYCDSVKKRQTSRRRLLIAVASILLEPVAMKLRGYRVGGNLVVSCR